MVKNYNFRRKVHYVIDDGNVGIAVNAQVIKGAHGVYYISWGDPEHIRYIDVDSIDSDEQDALNWTDLLGRNFIMRPMTLKAYNEIVSKAIPGARKFKTQKDLEYFFTQGWIEEMA